MAVAGQPDDDPTVPPAPLEVFRNRWAYGFVGNPMQAWLASTESGQPVGGYLLELPDEDNRDNAFAAVLVHPSRRRQGIGTALAAHLADQVNQVGRSLLMSVTRIGSPGNAFAAATGGRTGMREVRRILHADPGLQARLPALRAAAEPHAAEYTLRSWPGPTPDELVEGVCAVYTALGDAPHDAEFEPETWEAARLRGSEDRLVAQRSHWYSVAALAADGEVAAVTQLVVNPQTPDWGWQEITAVTRPHRGHRLGLLVKVAMLELLAEREPGLRRVATFNAAQNEHMIGVNEQLGYQVSDHFQSWQHDPRAAACAGGQS
jgi:GNAT superfamily N-acetyltransferase